MPAEKPVDGLHLPRTTIWYSLVVHVLQHGMHEDLNLRMPMKKVSSSAKSYLQLETKSLFLS